MYRIGDFSKLTGLSERTLRYYNEIGLLIPDYVDPYSGYRYYTDNNVNDYAKIKTLKDVNFSLEEIIKFKDELSSDIIEGKIAELSEQAFELETKISKLYDIRNTLLVKEKEYKDTVKVRKLTADKKVA